MGCFGQLLHGPPKRRVRPSTGCPSLKKVSVSQSPSCVQHCASKRSCSCVAPGHEPSSAWMVACARLRRSLPRRTCSTSGLYGCADCSVVCCASSGDGLAPPSSKEGSAPAPSTALSVLSSGSTSGSSRCAYSKAKALKRASESMSHGTRLPTKVVDSCACRRASSASVAAGASRLRSISSAPSSRSSATRTSATLGASRWWPHRDARASSSCTSEASSCMQGDRRSSAAPSGGSDWSACSASRTTCASSHRRRLSWISLKARGRASSAPGSSALTTSGAGAFSVGTTSRETRLSAPRWMHSAAMSCSSAPAADPALRSASCLAMHA
mmetsp:Transcript_16075/g.46280  ORF Transcript_16075/g.46280 Transcript_16075/m.46280 type:complete len:327 (-) Transcript_16075:574-1554(-)